MNTGSTPVGITNIDQTIEITLKILKVLDKPFERMYNVDVKDSVKQGDSYGGSYTLPLGDTDKTKVTARVGKPQGILKASIFLKGYDGYKSDIKIWSPCLFLYRKLGNF